MEGPEKVDAPLPYSPSWVEIFRFAQLPEILSKLSLQSFLKTVPMVIATSTLLTPPAILVAAEAPGSTENLKNDVEDAYSVQFLTLKEAYQVIPRRNYQSQYNMEEIPKSWQTDRLTLIQDILGELPPSFGRPPGQENQPIKFIISNETSNRGPLMIELGFSRFDPKNRSLAKDVIAHELTHSATPLTISGEEICSPWFDEIYQILGGSFGKTPPEIHEAFEAFKRRGQETDSQLVELLERGVNTYYPYELSGVMGGIYFSRGKDGFYQIFSQFLTPVQVDRIYQFYKAGVYSGREY